MPDLEIHYDGDGWAALYINGTLDTDSVGDDSIAEERAFKLLGVKLVFDAAFMRGQGKRDGVARTLAEVAEFRQARDSRAAEAKRLREEAQALIASAEELESGRG